MSSSMQTGKLNNSKMSKDDKIMSSDSIDIFDFSPKNNSRPAELDQFLELINED